MLSIVAPSTIAAQEDSSPIISIGPLQFLGPFSTISACAEHPGLIAILAWSGRCHELVNLYQTANLRASAINELECDYDSTTIEFAVHYSEMSAQCRSAIAMAILSEFD